MENIVFPAANTYESRSTTGAPTKRMLQAGHVHIGAAIEIVPTLRDFGIDPDPIIRQVGLEPSLFSDSDNMVQQTAMNRLLPLCVTRTSCSHFGLLVGKRATIRSLGLVGRLMQHSETVSDAVNTLVSHMQVQDRVVVPSFTINDDIALLTLSVYRPQTESANQISDITLAATVNALRSLCGASWNPTEVFLPRTAPRDREPFWRHYLAPVRFNHDTATIAFPKQDLDIRITGADPLLRDMLEQRIQQLAGPQGMDIKDDIRRLLRTRLGNGPCSADEIAKVFAMHRRTLSRHLRDGGVTYRALTSEMRFDIARQMIENTDVSLSEIALILGYSELSAFTRAFRSWSGQTPSAWRNAVYADKRG
ncbi:AraC family transcriptional regulator [Microvirga puerhi]|uniref:AraC family transcriptional regulator n=1 Tax=Microvirga puerhi TaxID=2876078 RepID=A0ABS7VHJ9_9HYPH|nr:AraC family transcriptional regulator [Microvirga puerhi]MBZ6074983.1 AraC family transcriptional regulator [Microvirga puerhi]